MYVWSAKPPGEAIDTLEGPLPPEHAQYTHQYKCMGEA